MVGDGGVPPSLAGMSQSQLYDIMCQMKELIEQNHQQARQILIQNPVLTRALFQAQIMLGMVQPPQTVSTISPPTSQISQSAVTQSQPSQQSTVQAATSFSGQFGQNQVRNQQSSQLMTSKPQSQPIRHPNPQPQSLTSQPVTSIQQPKGHLGLLPTPSSNPQSSKVPNVPLVQPSLQNTNSQYLATQQPLQPPLSAPQRPSIAPFSHQGHSQMNPNLGFQHPGGQQLHHSHTTFHSAAGAPGNPGSSFPQTLPNQPTLYQVGSSNQTDRGSIRMLDTKGGPFSGPPLNSGQMVGNSQSISPDLEKQLLQQVMSLTPEQIGMLPVDQRNQILQLQQFLRQ